MFLALLMSFAHAGVISVATQAPVRFTLDGQPIELAAVQTAAQRPVQEVRADQLPGGSYRLEAVDKSGRAISSIRVDLDVEKEVQLRFEGRRFALVQVKDIPADVVATRSGGAPVASAPAAPVASAPACGCPPTQRPLPTAPLVQPPRPAHHGEEYGDHHGGENRGGAQGGKGQQGAYAPAAPSAAPVPVELVRVDKEWSNVYLNGERVAEFRNQTGKSALSLKPGRYKLEVRDFMDATTWYTGYLVVEANKPLKIGIGAERAPEVFNNPSSFQLASR